MPKQDTEQIVPSSDDEKKELTSVFGLFKYADKKHILYMLVACFGTIISSAAIILFNSVFGYFLDVFIEYEQKRNDIINNSTRNGTESWNLGNSTSNDELDKLNSHFMNQTYYYSAFMAMAWFAYSFGRFLGLYCMQMFSLFYSTKLKRLFFQSIVSQTIPWFDQQKAGEYSSRISNDFKKFEAGINENFAMIFALVAQIIFGIIFCLIYGWKLALINYTFMPFIATGLVITDKYTSKYSKAETEIYAVASCIAEESISAIKTVKAFSAESRERERYNQTLEKGFYNAFRRNMFTAFNVAFDWGILYIFLGVGIYFGVKFIVDGEPGYTFGVVTMIMWNSVSVGYNIDEIAKYIETFNISRSVATKLFQIIDSKHENGSSSKMSSKNLRLNSAYKKEIEFRNINFHYPTRPEIQVLKNFNLKINSGETVALVGSSGCGKSTIIQLLQKFYKPISGDILVDGRKLEDLNDDWWRSQVGIVSQEPILFDDTIEHNILLGIKDSNAESCSVTEASKQANAHSFIQTLTDGYQTYVGESGTQLSGGQKQRIAIARALISCPSILLLDEATSALDVRSEKIVQQALDNASQNRTTLVVAHRLSTIKNVDRIIVIQDGEIVEEGNHEQLLKLNNVYSKMVEAQQVLLPEYSDLNEKNSCENNGNLLLTQESITEPITDTKYILDSGLKDGKIQGDTGQKKLVSYGRLWKLIKDHRMIFFIGSICSLGFGACTPLYALIYGGYVAQFTENGGNDGTLLERTSQYIWQFVGLGIGKFIVCLFQIIIFGYLGEKVTFNLRRQVFDSVLEQEVEWFDRKENFSGSVCARISDDAANIQSASGLRISTLLQSFSTMAITIPLCFYFSWQMAAISLLMIPIVIGAYMLSGKLSSEQASEESETAKYASKIVVQVINSVRTVVSLNKQNFFYDKFYTKIYEHQETMRSRALKKSLLYGFSMGTVFAAYGFALLYSAVLIKYNYVTVANAFKIIESMIFGATAVGSTSILSGDFAKARYAIASMLELIELKKDTLELEQVQHNEKASGDVEFRDVSFAYASRPTQKVLDCLSFTAEKGETVALVGASGCGKTTTIQLLEQFYKPDSGQILIDGKSNNGREWKRRQMALVSQEPILFNCSIRDNIAYGDTSRTVTDAEIWQACQSTNVSDFISELPQGLDTSVGQRGTQLSGGQKQRIAIARALIRNPPILILDEATSALDTKSEKLVQEALDTASQGRTCIVIAHRLKTIVNCNKIVVIHKGRAVEQGGHGELMEKRGYYWRLFNLSIL